MAVKRSKNVKKPNRPPIEERIEERVEEDADDEGVRTVTARDIISELDNDPDLFDNGESLDSVRLIGEELDMEVGPLGNTDYVPHGSPAHAILLSLTPDGSDLAVDFGGMEEKRLDAIKRHQQRVLNAGKPVVGKRVPQRWNPDANKALP